jgi:hypothetical protein
MIEIIDPFILNLKTNSEQKLTTIFSTLMEFKHILDNDKIFSKLSLEPIVAGGSIRDTVNNKSHLVKDVDIFLSFESLIVEQTISMDWFKHSCYENNYINHEHKFLPEEEQMQDSQFILKALLHVMNQHYNNIQEIYSNNFTSDSDEEYQDAGIDGVLKISDEALAYPVDLIINFISPNRIVHLFDFDLCKAYMSSSYDKDASLSTNALSNLKLTQEFKEDVNNKKISMNAIQFAESAVSRSILSHLPRLMDKYPEHTLNIQNMTNYPQATIALEKLTLERVLNQDIHIQTQNKKMKI